MFLITWMNHKIKKHYDWKMVAATESYGFFFGLLMASLFPLLVLYVNPLIYLGLFIASFLYPLYIWFKK